MVFLVSENEILEISRTQYFTMKRKTNSFDNYFEQLVTSFSNIPNFHLLQETEDGRRLFNLIVKTNAELNGLQTLFLNYYIPSANKSIVDSWNQLNKSSYKGLLNLNKNDLKDNLYETIRLGYVGLFHKYEAYLKALVEAVDFLIGEKCEKGNPLSLQEYCKKEFKVDIFRSHNLFYATSRVGYVCNCVKHWDGYPIKKPIHKDFMNFDPSIKIELSKEVFKSDIELIKIHCKNILSQILIIGIKQLLDIEISYYRDLQLENDILKQKNREAIRNMELILDEFRNPQDYFVPV